jgi:predicted nucleotidyltransferase
VDDQDDRGYSRAPELEDLASLCKALNDQGVRYVLIGGFAVILHGFVRATKDIDLLVDPSPENVQRLKRAMATLPDNAIALMADDEVDRYGVVRVADEFVVDLMKSACGIQYDEAIQHIDRRDVQGIEIPIADKELLIRTKDTVRPSDAADVRFLRLRISEEEKNSRR